MIILALLLMVVTARFVDIAIRERLTKSQRIVAFTLTVSVLPIFNVMVASGSFGLSISSVLGWEIVFLLGAASLARISGASLKSAFSVNFRFPSEVVKKIFRPEGKPASIWIWIIGLAIMLESFAFLGTLWQSRNVVPNRRDYDSVVYHLPIAFHWIQEGKIVPYESTDVRCWCAPINYECLLSWYLLFSRQGWSWIRLHNAWFLLAICLLPYIVLRLGNDEDGNENIESNKKDRLKQNLWSLSFLGAAAIYSSPMFGFVLLPTIKNDFMTAYFALTGLIFAFASFKGKNKKAAIIFAIFSVVAGAAAGGAKSPGWVTFPFIIILTFLGLLKHIRLKSSTVVLVLLLLISLPWNSSRYLYVKSRTGNINGPSEVVNVIQSPPSFSSAYTNCLRFVYRSIDIPIPIAEAKIRSWIGPLARAVGYDGNTPQTYSFFMLERRPYFVTTGSMWILFVICLGMIVKNIFTTTPKITDFLFSFVGFANFIPFVALINWQWGYHEAGGGRFFIIPYILWLCDGLKNAFPVFRPRQWILSLMAVAILLSSLTVAGGHVKLWWNMGSLDPQNADVQLGQSQVNGVLEAARAIPPGGKTGLISWSFNLYFYIAPQGSGRIVEFDWNTRFRDPKAFVDLLRDGAYDALIVYNSCLSELKGKLPSSEIALKNNYYTVFKPPWKITAGN